MAFAWGDAASAGADERRRQKQDAFTQQTVAAELENQLAELAFRQAQEQRIRDQMGMQQKQFEANQATAAQEASDKRNQQGLVNMAGDAADLYQGQPEKLMGTFIRAGIPIGPLVRPQPTGDTQWVKAPDGTEAFRVPQQGDSRIAAQTTSSGPNVGSFEDYVIRSFGPNPTPQQIAQARKVYNQADDRPLQAAGQGGTAGRASQAQFTVAGYAERIAQAEPTLTATEKAIVGMNPVEFWAQAQLPPAMQSKEMQNYMQAGRNLINAQLRRESGAVISDSEFKEARAQYLPAPGDDESTLALKRANRRQILESNRRAAGSALPQQPNVGDVKTFPNGRKGRWNGQNWVQVQ